VHNNEKKGVTLSGIRIDQQAAKEFKRALEHYHIARADFARMCINRLIEHYQAGDPLALPLAFEKPAQKKRKTKRSAL
jgi:hypothetical protein